MAYLSTIDPYITILTNNSRFGDIPEGEIIWGSESYEISADVETPQSHEITFTLSIGGSNEWNWKDTFHLWIGKPDIIHIGHLYDDSEGGDGDGVPEPGETIRMKLTLRNTGYGDADSIYAFLISPDPAKILVLDSCIFFGDIQANTEKRVSDDFFIFKVLTYLTPDFQLELRVKDIYNRVWSSFIDLTMPSAPDNLSTVPHETTIELRWEPSLSSDIWGYNIYRTPIGDKTVSTKLNIMPITSTYYLDDGLSPGEEWYYYVTPVDSSANEGPSSDLLLESTNPPLHSGWPAMMEAGSKGSAVVVELDGISPPEILIGSLDGKIYAWHADGTPVTGWSVEIGGRIYGSIAVGDLEGDGYLDIVCASWDTVDQNVYVFEWTGAIKEGWPRPLRGDTIMSRAGVIGTPALSDLDADGKLEIIVGAANGDVYIWRHDGSPFLVPNPPPPGYYPGLFAERQEDYYSGSSPAIADIDNDGILDIVLCSVKDSSIYAWNSNGELLDGFPVKLDGYMVLRSPSIGDLSSSYPGLEIVVATEQRVFTILI